MNSVDIENFATNKIIDLVLQNSDIFSPYINSNDRTPLWDGNIFIYNKNTKTNDVYEGKIDLQIKGRKVDVFKDKNTYSFKIETLKGYQKEVKGTLLLVVDFIMKIPIEYKIYYCNLLPVDLYEILKDVPQEQKTINLKLKEIQEKGPLSFKNVCLNFYNNSKFQVGKEIIDVNQFDRIESITTIYSGDENGFATHFKSGDVYTYAKLKDSDKEFAMVKAKEWIPYREIKKDIKIEDKKYASSYIVIGDGAEEIKINQVRISFDENKVHFEIKGNVYERIKSIQFILALLKNQYIMVGDYKLNLPLNNQEKVEESIKLYEKELEYYNMVKNAFGVFNTKFDIPYENLSEDDEKQLFVLIGLFNGRIREDIKVLHKYYICINKYKFLFMILRDKKRLLISIHKKP
ncbi:MAG: hypothetical protein IJY25_04065 [Bacilli bacterium]|nr:hypothetical protein [Bacilli bacterium]